MHAIVFAIFLLAAANANGMPRDLVLLGKNIRCFPDANFYDRDGRVFPDFINEQDGSINSSEDWRAAFWCRHRDAKAPYWLVFAIDGQLQHWDGCEAVIKWRRRPGGLRIHDRIVPLNIFFDLISGKPINGTGQTRYRPLSDTYDGSGFVFYCHDKRWIYAPLD